MADDHLHFEWMKLDTSAVRNDTKLAMCPLPARAVAFLILTLQSESERRGYLLVNSKKPDEKTLAKLLHITRRECRKAIPELLDKGVFLEDADGVLYSPRMVRDHKKFLEASANGRKGGGNPALRVLPFDAKNTDKGTDKAPYKGASKLEARGESSESSTSVRSVLGARTTAQPPVPKHVRPRVPPPVHEEFLSKLGGDDSPSDLIAFYERVTAEWKDRTIDDNDFVFWRARWCEWRGTSSTRTTPAADRMAASIDGLSNFVRRRAAQ